MNNIYSKLGINLEIAKGKCKSVELAKRIKEEAIDISKTNEKETNDIIACFLIAIR